MISQDRLFELGMVKLASDNENGEQPKKRMSSAKKGALIGAGIGTGLAGINYLSPAGRMSLELGKEMFGLPKATMVTSGLLTNGGMGAGIGALIGRHKDKKREKTASAEEYVEALEKVAFVTGIDAEVLDQAIAYFQEDMIKEAQINEELEGISEEEAGEILQKLASQDPEIASLIQELEEQDENEELSKIASFIDSLTDAEAESLLAQINGN